ncbi:hypothetical protein VNI00_012326 [Paramarasmius palmivorus]|uniref:Uncharacterized protein n=1 Tax=Paramarasmius palmivorus TaxID=297713 RepID=A0AAW0C6K7_9AGAR
MPPVSLKNHGRLRASTPSPPTSPLLPRLPSPLQSSTGSTVPSQPSFEEYWWCRSSPALSAASSDSDQSLISALWDKIYKGRVLVEDSDGWRYEWHDEVHDKIPGQSSKPCTEVKERADEHPASGKSLSDNKCSSRLVAIDKHTFYGSPFVSTPPATVEVTTPVQIKRAPVQGGNPRKGTSPKRPRLSTSSAERRRLLERESKARQRARNWEAMKAKQAIYAANYRTKNRETLRVKARQYRQKRKETQGSVA